MLNRAAMILRQAKPYLEWAKSLDHDGMVPDPTAEQTVYLIPQFEGLKDKNFIAFLEEMFDYFFACELHAWHTRESDWPQNRTLAMFRKWFHIEFHSILQDVVDDVLEDDDD